MLFKLLNPASELDRLKEELTTLHENRKLLENRFDNCTDMDYLDSIIYEMKALDSQYNYILSRVRGLEKLEAAATAQTQQGASKKGKPVRRKNGEHPAFNL